MVKTYFGAVKLFSQQWAGPLVLFISAVVSVFLLRSYGTGEKDFYQMLFPTEALATFQVDEIYPPLSSATSLTGWLLLVIIPYTNLKVVVGASSAFIIAGLVSIPLLVGGVRYAAMAIHPKIEESRAWFLACLSLVLPTTWAAWYEFYHPQDVAATGLMLFALGATAKRKWLLAGVLLGLTILTRHWAVLVGLAMVILVRRHAWKIVLSSFAVLVVGLVPLFLIGNEGLISGATAQTGFITYRTFVGRIAIDNNLSTTIYRGLPIAASFILCCILWLKRVQGRAYLVPLAASVIFLRLLFDIAPYVYYWIPAITLMLLVSVRPKAWIPAAILSAAVWPIQILWGDDSINLTVAWITAIGAIVGMLLTWILALKYGDIETEEETEEEAIFSDKQNQIDQTQLKTNRRVWIATSVLAAVVFVSGCFSAVDMIAKNTGSSEVPLMGGKEIIYGDPMVTMAPDKTRSLIGQPMPTITGFDTAQITQTFEPTSNSRSLLLGFWVHWCEQCEKDIPDVVKWLDQNEVDGKILLGPVAPDKPNPAQRFWLIDGGWWDGPTIVDSLDSRVRSDFGFQNYPAYVIADKNGIIVDAWEGPWDQKRAEKALEK